MYDLKIDVHLLLLLGAPFHIGGLVRDVRLSCGAGLAIRLGIAQIELNYSVPLRAHATDRCVCVLYVGPVCVCVSVYICVFVCHCVLCVYVLLCVVCVSMLCVVCVYQCVFLCVCVFMYAVCVLD